MIEYKYDLTGSCPDEKKVSISYDNYYRITKNKELNNEDFIPQYWTQPHHRAVKFKGKECEYQGLSCFATFEEAKNMLDRYGALGNHIYKAENLERYATIKDIGKGKYPTHVNVYVYKNVEEAKDIVWELKE
ncbi:hypothetical protein GCM10012288_19080 [Malaciobacter pacificus]|uniref:Uncharacterized protein n=1 Tax=Malaciobacter pacificus TaxID=1080223 RepID=A0A5C2H8B1_9BACT|nr:hypothetical protein [Malaciobacter pacificus]QEP35201.1 hypothetical protein APAC_2130 [Malaciobacter pacificus]GGD44941.1 hypothetical protein GCM10012288_19080 [Malaciobacter pacificus]